MEQKNCVKKMLVIGVIFFFLSTGFVQGKFDTISKEIDTQPLSYEGVIPYLEVQLAEETQTFTPTDDTYIANYDPSEINGALDYLATRNRYGAGSNIWECDILIKFDLSSIPPGTPVLAASLNLYYNRWGDSNPVGRPLTAYKVTSDWDEMSVNFNTQPSKASTISDSQNVPGSVQMWMSWELTGDVQQYVDNPGVNFGWEIMDETYWGYYDVPVAYFYPKEYVYTPPVEPFIPYLKVVMADETQTFTPTDDTYIANYDPSEINGALDYLATRNRYGAGSNIWECDILIKFDLSSIPPETPILTASLNLYYNRWGDSNPVGRPLTAYKVTSDWDEMSVNFNTQPSKSSNVSAVTTVPNSVGVGMSWELTDDVQQYVDNPGVNFGWEIMDETYWGWYDVPVAYFYPKEYVYTPPADPFIPYLEVVLANETYSFPPTDDTYIANYDPSEINGALDYLATRNRYGAGSDIWECDILIKFDLSSIPPGTPVLAASLNLYYNRWGDSNPVGRPLTAYKVTSDWDEMSVNFNTQPSKANTISEVTNVPNAVGVGMSWELTDDVQQYVDNPQVNFGWEIMDETYWGWYDVPVAYFYPKEIEGGGNTPPDTPSITGPTQGKIGIPSSFDITALDADGDNLYYYIDWGDNTNSGWVGPYTSKGEITQTHTWLMKGAHHVKVKAKDIYDTESNWGTLDVTVPKSYLPFSLFFEIIQRIMERFPHAFPLLRQLIE